MVMFNKPKWMKPEINEWKYYLHLLIILVVVLGILQYSLGEHMLTLKNVVLSIPLLTIGDIVAHSLLQLD